MSKQLHVRSPCVIVLLSFAGQFPQELQVSPQPQQRPVSAGAAEHLLPPAAQPAEGPTAAAAGEADDEFDYSAELEAAASSPTAAVANAALPDASSSPQQSPRSPLTPAPIPVDDSSAHITEYLGAVCCELLLTLPAGKLPERIQPLQELLSLELYLAVEKGNPAWLELPDESHIFHKALYDALNQALQQLYAEMGRVLPGPGEVRGVAVRSGPRGT